MPMDALRVMVVDDHAVLRAGLQLLIDGQPDMTVVAEAGNAQEALQVVEQQNVDVIVMDLSLPDGDGITLTEQILRQRPEMRVVGLTRHEERGYMERMLEVGARGYVLKQSVAHGLLTAIRTVAAGQAYIDPHFMNVDRTQAAQQDRIAAREGVQAAEANIRELAADEVRVLQRVAANQPNSEIAAQLGMSVAAIAEHKAHAMEKLGLRTRIDILRYAEAQGWKGTEE